MASSVPPVQTVMSGPSAVTSIAGSMLVSSTDQVTTHNSSPASVAYATSNVPGNSSIQPASTQSRNMLKCGRETYVRRDKVSLFSSPDWRDTVSTHPRNWPSSMEIVRLISQDYMNTKECVRKGDLVVFRAMNNHGFLEQLQEKKLCAVIQLPSQTLLLSVSDKVARLIGMLFPTDMVVSRPKPTTASTTPETATAAAAASTNEAVASSTATTMPGGTFTS